MFDSLFVHVNGLTKDLYGSGDLDLSETKETEASRQRFIEQLEKEIRSYVKCERYQIERIKSLENEVSRLRVEVDRETGDQDKSASLPQYLSSQSANVPIIVQNLLKIQTNIVMQTEQQTLVRAANG